MENTLKKFILIFGLALFFFFFVMRPTPAKAGTFWISFGSTPVFYSTAYPHLYFGSPYLYGYYYNPFRVSYPRFYSSFSWAKMKKDTERAIQLTEIKKQEYFARKEAEEKQNQQIESREIKKEDLEYSDPKENEIEFEIKSPNEEIRPLETTIFDDGAVAINYY